MTSPLAGGIASAVAAGLSSIMLDATLTRATTTGGNAWDTSSGTTTTATYACKGFVEDYAAREVDGTLVQANDRKVTVLAKTLAVTPVPEDKITISGATYRVISVKSDPAQATFTMQGRTS